MAKTAIALIIAGTGEITDKETFDLLEDAYPLDDFEIGLVVPLDKDLHTDAVKHAVKWFDSDKDVLTVQTTGASMSRGAAKLGGESPQKVDKFSDILNLAEFQGEDPWDEVHFLVALPEDPEDPEYDLYAEMVEAAIDGGLTVKNLAKGLDDVELADDEPEPEEEPEPEPVKEEKPAPRARRSRAKKVEEPEPDPVVAEAIAKISDEPEPVKATQPKPARDKDVEAAVEAVGSIANALEAWDKAIAAFDAKDVTYRPLTVRAREAYDVLSRSVQPASPEPQDTKDEEKPAGRGRGRPRTQFEVKQVWDEDEGDDGDWVPRPAGRLRKGTEWRTIHAETEEVLDEGTA